MFFCTYLLGSLFLAIYFNRINSGKYVMYFLGLIYIFISVEMNLDRINNMWFEKWSFGIWFTLTIMILPYILFNLVNKYVYDNEKILKKLRPNNTKEINREDSIIIDG